MTLGQSGTVLEFKADARWTAVVAGSFCAKVGDGSSCVPWGPACGRSEALDPSDLVQILCWQGCASSAVRHGLCQAEYLSFWPSNCSRRGRRHPDS